MCRCTKPAKIRVLAKYTNQPIGCQKPQITSHTALHTGVSKCLAMDLAQIRSSCPKPVQLLLPLGWMLPLDCTEPTKSPCTRCCESPRQPRTCCRPSPRTTGRRRGRCKPATEKLLRAQNTDEKESSLLLLRLGFGGELNVKSEEGKICIFPWERRRCL